MHNINMKEYYNAMTCVTLTLSYGIAAMFISTNSSSSLRDATNPSTVRKEASSFPSSPYSPT